MKNIRKKIILYPNLSNKKNSNIEVFRSMIFVAFFSVILILGTTGITSTSSSSSLVTQQGHIVYAQHVEDCSDGIDNDGDLDIDTNDSDCSGTSSSIIAETTSSGAQSSETFYSVGSAQSNIPVGSAQSNIPLDDDICNPSSVTLRITAKGSEVTNLQNILIRLGYSVGPKGADGDFGRATQAAVIKFQQDKGLNKIDGEVGPETWNALCSILSSPTTQATSPTTQASPLPAEPSNTGYVKCTQPGKDPDSLKKFINNPEASTLDFLPKDECLKYRKNIQWTYYDYYGGKGTPLKVPDKFGNTVQPEGPNEKYVPAMIAGLKKVNPERRATVEESGVPAGTAVLCVKCSRDDPHIITQIQGNSQKRMISPQLWSWIQEQLVHVSGIGTEKASHQLNKYAAESFAKMREDAKKDGINLVILSGTGAAFRDKTAADTGCAKARNSFAVACFPNSHNLGLAIDLHMRHGGQQKYEEATTLGKYGMQNVVDMRQSPVHKWLFLNAAKYNFYPFTHEPWHWEYNPTNFANTFFAGAPG